MSKQSKEKCRENTVQNDLHWMWVRCIENVSLLWGYMSFLFLGSHFICMKIFSNWKNFQMPNISGCKYFKSRHPSCVDKIRLVASSETVAPI